MIRLLFRIQPLSGRVSAVTQLQSETYLRSPISTPGLQSTSSDESCGRPASDAAAEVGREEEGQREENEGEEDTASVASHGDMFAGVGEFSQPPQSSAPQAQMKDLNMKYARDAMLR